MADNQEYSESKQILKVIGIGIAFSLFAYYALTYYPRNSSLLSTQPINQTSYQQGIQSLVNDEASSLHFNLEDGESKLFSDLTLICSPP